MTPEDKFDTSSDTQSNKADDETRNSIWDKSSVTACIAACILAAINAIGLAASILLFFKYRTVSKDQNLSSFQGSIVDPVGIRWVVTMSVTGGSCAILILWATWLSASYRTFERKRRKRLAAYFEDGDIPRSRRDDDPDEYERAAADAQAQAIATQQEQEAREGDWDR